MGYLWFEEEKDKVTCLCTWSNYFVTVHVADIKGWISRFHAALETSPENGSKRSTNKNVSLTHSHSHSHPKTRSLSLSISDSNSFSFCLNSILSASKAQLCSFIIIHFSMIPMPPKLLWSLQLCPTTLLVLALDLLMSPKWGQLYCLCIWFFFFFLHVDCVYVFLRIMRVNSKFVRSFDFIYE